MAMHVPGRTDNQIKNRFNSNLKKRLEDQVFLKQLMDFKLPKLSEEQSKDAQSKDMHVEPSCDSVTFDHHKNKNQSKRFNTSFLLKE